MKAMQLVPLEEAERDSGGEIGDTRPPVFTDEEPPLPESPNVYGHIRATPRPLVALPFRLPLTVSDWLARDLPEPDCLLGHWLTATSRCLFVGATGLGKSLALIAFGMAVADGSDFLHWRGRRPARVLYIDGEMSRTLLKKRIADEVSRRGAVPENFHALSHEDIEGFAPLNTPAGQACIEKVMERIGGVDLVIFDSVMCLIVGDMKDEESWQQTMPWVRDLTRRNIGQIWGHHTGHDESRSYGTKTREWQMDTVAILESVHRPDTDVSFSLVFRKARERTPVTRADFQRVFVALVDDRWICDASDAQRTEHVPPLTLKFFDALLNVLASEGTVKIHGRSAASSKAWKAECEARGLLDPEKPHSARTLFAKHRRDLVAANRIACEGEWTWAL